MDDKIKFQEMLLDILEIAKVQGNQLGMNEIKTLFGDMSLSEAQYEHIFAYLAAHKIEIKGYVEKSNEYTDAVKADLNRKDSLEESIYEQSQEDSSDKKESKNNQINEEDSVYLKMYLEDLEGVPLEKDGEIERIITLMRSGDLSVKTRFLELYLRRVLQIAQEYKSRGVILEDLIQEGNIGLMYAVERFVLESDIGDEIEFIDQTIKEYIELAISEEIDSENLEKRVMDKISYVTNAAKELEEDLCREATLEELSAFLKMSKEEVADILNMSVDAVKLSHSHDNHNKKDK